MHNLIPTTCLVLPVLPTLVGVECVCLDTDKEGLWIVSDGCVHFIYSHNGQVERIVHLVNDDHMTDEDYVVGIEYLSEMGVVCIVTKKGEVVTCNTIVYEVEIVGDVDDGIEQMAWSPDQDLVVMVTGAGNLVLMTRDFDPLTEVSMFPEEFGEAKPITVGWGKKETQFHGSLGKPTAQQLTQQPVHPAMSWDDRKPRISWRGDGEYFVCSSIEPSTGARKLRVWTRQLTLYSTSESADGLEYALHWRPSGNLIASTQRKPHRHDVIFYESNGLRHGEFTLRVEKLDWIVNKLFWNADSTVLAIWLEKHPESKSDSEPKTLVQLWSCSNYHWYLKQELQPTGATPTGYTSSLVSAIWDPILALRLHLLLSTGHYIIYDWKWGVATNGSICPDNNSPVAVIDGATLHYTPFRHVVIPPPMSAHEISFPSPISLLTFAPPPHPNDVIVVLTDGRMGLLSFKEVGGATAKPKVSQLTCLHHGGVSFVLHDLRQLVWWKEYTLLGITCQSCDQFIDAIVELEISNNEDKLTVVEKKRVKCDGHIICLHSNLDTRSVAIEFQDGRVFRYNGGNNKCSLSPWVLPNNSHVTFGGISCDHISLNMFQDQECVIGLNTQRRQLYVNNTKVSSKCTSFAVHNEFVILTTDSHTIRCLSLHLDPSTLTEFSSEDGICDETIRRVERGARIVTVVPYDIKVVLLMPRGNLETISPRALVLSLIRYHLDRFEYDKAFLIMRKHRINMNLLCDHNMAAFLSHTKQFVEQLNDVNFINLFLTELRNEDVTQTTYPIPYWSGSEPSQKQSRNEPVDHSKVNTVCDAIREALHETGERKFILTILTTYICKTPQELDNVLLKIKELRDSPGSPSESVTVDEALKYTMILVDINQLYDIALGLYDYSLVLTVAEKSQKDPKEYLPFLNELRQLPLHYQRYRIDKYLKRYEKALVNISHCVPDKFDECLKLIKEQKLYKSALKIFTDKGSHEHHVISKLYGEYLADNGHFKEAAIVYQSCGELELSMAAFEKAGNWEFVFVLSAQLGHDEGHRHSIARKIANHLKSLHQFSSAARVLIDYAEDIEGAVGVSIEGRVWEEALRLIHLYNRTDLIDKLVKPGLLEAQRNHLLLMETQQDLFLHHCSRLQKVREEKSKKMEAIFDGTYAVDEKEADLFSDTSSITGQLTTSSSRATRTSAKSAKNRRKAERKKYSLKEGSQFEDMALMDALKDIITRADHTQDEIGSLLNVLCLFDLTSEARELQERFQQFLDSIQDHLVVIWPPTAQTSLTGNSGTLQRTTGPQSTVNSIIAAMKSVNINSAPLISQPVFRVDMKWKLPNYL